MTYVVITPVLIVPVVLVLVRHLLTPEQVSLAVISFASLGHHLPGFMRAYGDSELFQRYRVRFLLVPPLVFAIALLFSPPSFVVNGLNLPWRHLHGLELLLLVWGTWHGLMQTYGFMRIYDVRRGIHDRLSARLDHSLCVIVFAVGVVFSDARMFGLAKGMWESGLPLFGPHWLTWSRWVVGVLAIVILVAYAANLIRQTRRGVSISGVKLLLVGITGWFYWYTGRLSVNVLIGIAMFEIYHAVQYYAIVWIYNRRLFRRAGERFGPLGFVFQDRWSMLGIYLAAIAAYSSIRYFTVDANEYIFSGGGQDAYQWLIALFVTSSFLHFYYDGFIWKVSERKTQENLVDKPVANAPLMHLVPGAVHAAKWLVLLAIIGGLLTAEWKRLPESRQQETERLEALAALTPELPECQSLLSRNALERGNATEAIRYAQQAVHLRPRSHSALADLGLALMMGGRLEDAQDRLEEAIAIAPDQWAYHCDLGLILAKLGDFERAEQELLTAVRLQPNHEDPHQRLADFYLTTGQSERAARQFEIIAERFPDSLTAEIGEVVLLTQRGEHDEAIQLAEFLVAGNPRNWRVLLVLGGALNAAEESEAALVPRHKATRLRPNSADAHYQLGLAQLRVGKLLQSLRSLKQAVQVDAQHFPAQFQLGNTYYVVGEHQAALNAYQRAQLLQPRNAELCSNLGGLLSQMGRWQEAEKTYRHGLAAHPESPQLNYNLGVLLWQRGQQGEARQHIYRAAELGMQIPEQVRQALEQ